MNSWEQAWKYSLALPEATPEWLVALALLFVIHLFVVLPHHAWIYYLDRKLCADLQARVGPNQAGAAGMFQPLADFLKLLQKVNSQSGNYRDAFWIILYAVVMFSSVAVLPLGSLTLLVDTDVSALFPFFAVILGAFVTLLMGLDQQAVPGFFGGIRVAAQAISGAFPAILSVLCVGLRAGSFKWAQISSVQGAWPHQWLAFQSPFEFISFFVFVASGVVLLSIPPLEGGFLTPDLQSGVAARLQSGSSALFQFSRFYGLFMWSILASALFLGGWHLPESLALVLKQNEAWRTLQFLEMATIIIKADLILIALSLIAAVNPRLRGDQATDMSWRVLSPLALLCLAGTVVWIGIMVGG